LNFTIVNVLFNLDIVCAVESVIPKLPPIFGMEFRWNVRYRLKKSKHEGIESCEVPEVQQRDQDRTWRHKATAV
jgi:hypothetical protein